MVKAIKRKPAVVLPRAQKKGMSRDRKMQIMMLTVLALIFLGFTVSSYFGMSQNPAPVDDGREPEPQEYSVGVRAGSEDSKIMKVTEYSAVFGQLDAPLDTKRRLGGELYALDDGYSQLVLTNASVETINQWTHGEFVIYNVARCSDFDCLIDDNMASNLTTTYSFYLYSLNSTSEFLQTRTIGLPSISVVVVL